jgi:hypothetical protein
LFYRSLGFERRGLSCANRDDPALGFCLPGTG